MKDKLRKDIKKAMLDGRKEKVTILKTLLGEIENKRDQDPESIVRKFIKDAQSTIEIRSKAFDEGKLDADTLLGEQATTTLEILCYQQYLPKQLTEDEIRGIVSNEIELGNNFGGIMGVFKKNYPNQYDGALVSKIVKEMI